MNSTRYPYRIISFDYRCKSKSLSVISEVLKFAAFIHSGCRGEGSGADSCGRAEHLGQEEPEAAGRQAVSQNLEGAR
jgi:hypothetical protein